MELTFLIILVICLSAVSSQGIPRYNTPRNRHHFQYPRGNFPGLRSLESARCPRMCRCYDRIGFCSAKKLLFIPRRFPRDIVGLYLERNQIKRVPPNIFAAFPSLDVISLRKNQLNNSAFRPRSFAGLHRLRKLDLSRNLLGRIPTRLPNSLRSLDVSFNRLKDLRIPSLINLTNLMINFNNLTDREIKPGIFRKLTSLERLDLVSNHLRTVPQDFPPSLLYLRIEDNRVTTVPDGIFTSLSKVHHVYLRDNQLNDESIPFNAWENMTNLFFVDLSENQLRTVPRGFPKKLGLLLLEYNRIESINWQTFSNLPNLEQIRLSHNNIDRIALGSFEGLRKLTYLDLSHNELMNVPRALPTGLQFLLLNSNLIFSVEYDAFCTTYDVSKLQMLRLDSNPLVPGSIPAFAFYCLTSTQVITT